MGSADKLANLKVNAKGPKPEVDKVTALHHMLRGPRTDRNDKLVKKGIQLQSEQARRFDVLRAEIGCKGYELWNEAVDLLVKKYSRADAPDAD